MTVDDYRIVAPGPRHDYYVKTVNLGRSCVYCGRIDFEGSAGSWSYHVLRPAEDWEVTLAGLEGKLPWVDRQRLRPALETKERARV